MGRIGLVGLMLFGAASLAFFRVNDRIVGDICRRENRPHPGLWTLSPYWQWRTIAGGWYADARRAGLLLPKAMATAALILSVIGSVLAGMGAMPPG